MLKNSFSRKRKLSSATKTPLSRVAAAETEKIEVENVNHPGRAKSVDASMYHAMKRAFLKILPKTSPGVTVVKIQEQVIAQ